MTGELSLEDQLRSRHGRADPGPESESSDRAALARALEALRTTAQVEVTRAAARSHMRYHGELMRAGRGNEADKAAADADSMSDPYRTPDVELELAARAAAIGSPADAERRYRGLLAALGDESALGAVAAFRLAHLRIERGAREEAIGLWKRALRSADENLRPHVLVELADRLRGRGRGRGDQVERLYAQAIATDHPDLAPRAALTLGGLREEAGDNKGALELYALVAASQHPDHASDAEARHGALIHRRTKRAIEQMLLFELKNGCDAKPDDGPSARECGNEQGSVTHFAGLPGWCRRPRADPEPPHDLGHRRLSSYKRLVTRLLDRDGGLGLLGTMGSQHLRKDEPAPAMPIGARSHIPHGSPTDGGDRGLDYVVIFGNDTAATSLGGGAQPNRKIALARLKGSRSYEAGQDALQNIADGMSGGGAGLGEFAGPSMDIETIKNLVLCCFSADQQSPWEAVLDSPRVERDGQPHTLIEGRTIALAFGDRSASPRDIGAMDPASSDHLLLSHITHALTVLHCKEALMTGSLIGMNSSCWSDAMDGFDPGLARWRTVFEGPAATCRCESTTCGPGVGCLGQR
jgi:tetratricopeptide (TPR) repeat protein